MPPQMVMIIAVFVFKRKRGIVDPPAMRDEGPASVGTVAGH